MNTNYGANPVPPPYYPPNQSVPPSPPAPPPQYTPFKKEIVPSSGRDVAFALITVLFSIIAVDFSLFSAFNLGFTITYFIFIIISLIYLADKGLKLDLFSAVCGLLALAGSVVFGLYRDEYILFWLFCGIGVLTALMFSRICGTARYRFGYLMAYDAVRTGLYIPLAYVAKPFSSLFAKSEEVDGAKRRRAGSIVIGLALAIPALLVVVPILIQSDAAFEGMLKRIFGDLERLLGAVFFGIILSFFVFSLLFALKKRLDVKKDTEKGFALDKIRSADTVVANSFLGAISFFYVIYMLAQLAYFFSAFSGILPKGYSITAAEYARRGFFDLATIAVINLVMLFFVFLFLKRGENGKIPLSTRLVSLFICLFTLMLSAIAFSKMVLYIRSFGMTRLRILTSAFMIVVALTVLAVIFRLFIQKFPYAKMVVISVAIVGLITAFADIDNVVARYNVEAYQKGYVKEIDVSTLSELSNSAVPSLVNLIDDKNEEVQKQVVLTLHDRLEMKYNITDSNYEEINPMDFRSFNLTEYKANELLWKNREKIVKLYKQFWPNGYSYESHEDNYDYSSEYGDNSERGYDQNYSDYSYSSNESDRTTFY